MKYCLFCGLPVRFESDLKVVQVWFLTCGVENKLFGVYHRECFDRMLQLEKNLQLLLPTLKSRVHMTKTHKKGGETDK